MDKATALRALHVPGDPLVLPNAWDAASAAMVEAAGFPAVATSSNAMAAVLGYDDGEAASIERGARYLAAGADCVYPIAAADPDVIRRLVDGIPGPVNVGFLRTLSL